MTKAGWKRAALGAVGAAAMIAAGAGAYLAGRGDNAAGAPAWSTVPKPVAPLSFIGLSETSRSLEDFRGKVVLLNLWATWCAPCREEMPSLDRLQRALGGADFEVVALSMDREGLAVVRRFYEELGIRALAPYVDPSMRAGASLNVPGLPTTVLLDREGNERWRKTGPEKWDAPELIAALRARLRPD